MATACELTYKNIISKFYSVDRDRDNSEKLISDRKTRIENGFEFVFANVPNRNLSKKMQDKIRSKVASVEATFYKKWRESKCKSRLEFEKQFEKWIHAHIELPPSITSLNSRQRGSTQTKKKFNDLSERQKNRRVEELGDWDVDHLLLAAANAAKRSKFMDLEYVLKALHKDHKVATQIRNLLKD